jgi:hypothetical protein
MDNPETDILVTINVRDGLTAALRKVAEAFQVSAGTMASAAMKLAVREEFQRRFEGFERILIVDNHHEAIQKMAAAVQEMRDKGMQPVRGFTLRSEFTERVKMAFDELEAIKCAEATKYTFLEKEQVDWPGLRKCTGFRGPVQKPYTRPRFHVKHACTRDRRVMKRKNYIKQVCRKNG